MGQGSSLARAWPGALGFWRALGLTLRQGLKPGLGLGLWSKAQGLKGLLDYDFLIKNWHYGPSVFLGPDPSPSHTPLLSLFHCCIYFASCF